MYSIVQAQIQRFGSGATDGFSAQVKPPTRGETEVCIFQYIFATGVKRCKPPVYICYWSKEKYNLATGIKRNKPTV